MEQTKPLLSIGMIFRDDIRSIDRCLRALQPLREAIPCELVMADTGSVDGSRRIAEHYADILIDFEWINDFSAARNAVMDACSGKWHLTIDTDEYLREDSDLNELIAFLKTADAPGINLGTVVIRNHTSYDLDGNYTDFMGVRLLRMSTGARYQGAMHEQWVLPPSQFGLVSLPGVVFDHDGYVEFGGNSEKGKKKRERNMTLLREKLQKNPTSLLTRLQIIESGESEEDFLKQTRHAVRMVKRKVPTWNEYGPSILRHAVYTASARNLPEFDEWAALAWELFPESMHVRLDIEYALFSRSWNENNYADCVERGERYLKAMEDFRAGKDATARMYSVVKMSTPLQEQGVKIVLSSACTYEKQYTRALELLSTLDYSLLNDKQTMDILKSAQEVHFRSDLDTAPLIRAIWAGIAVPKPSEKRAEQRIKVFNAISALAFRKDNREREAKHEAFRRHGYTLYLPLKGEAEIGNAAELMGLSDIAAQEAVLRQVKDWQALPIEALAHALVCGVSFPLQDKPLPIEEMEGLAKRLAQDSELLDALVLSPTDAVPDDWQRLTWRRGLAIAAVRVFEWEKTFHSDDDETRTHHCDQGLALARVFARTEQAFISRYYQADTWREENIYVLPPMHRFGWYCVQAFEALDRNDYSGCVQKFRTGLDTYQDVAKMVEFLLDRVAEMEKASRIAAAPEELVLLAQQVRTMLARFDPEDPAVAELKKSAAYQQVAWMIDEPASAFGKLLQ